MYHRLTAGEIPPIEAIGGKARSLMILKNGGFNVPDGMVLPVGFFSPWLEKLMRLDGYREAVGHPENYYALATRLKEVAETLDFSESQREAIQSFLSGYGGEALFAVRSSSPEEDLSGASFAGGYETVLGVTKEGIFGAVKTAFKSCLDERVLHYKAQRGFDPGVLRIAVVVQEQIDSEVSGVGFSINPLTNDFDEVVIDSNFGLGESVVSGQVTPDEYIVDKLTLKVKERRLGTKAQTVRLLQSGGVETVTGDQRESLDEEHIVELTRLVTDIEAFYGFPVDIEWAFADGRLHLLQSRPVTTYVPLPEVLQTAPGEKRLLYMDGSLIKQGISEPISVLGCEVIGETQRLMFKSLMGKDVTADPLYGMAATVGGRMYMNLSTGLKFQGYKKTIQSWEMVDVITARLIQQIDLAPYELDRLPEVMKGAKWGAIVNNISTLRYILKARRDPQAYKVWYQPYEEAFDTFLETVVEEEMPLSETPHRIIQRYIALLDKMLPMTYTAELARAGIRKQLARVFDDGEEKMKYLERSLPDNVTIDMGLRMYNLSLHEAFDEDFASFGALLEKRAFPEDFLSTWDEFMRLYGCRTTRELDVAAKRGGDNLEAIHRQIAGMRRIGDRHDPQSIYQESERLRDAAYTEILEALSGRERTRFEKSYAALVALGGKREALKYWYIRSIDAVRRIILRKAARLVSRGVIDEVEDIYWLGIDQIDQAGIVDRETLQAWIAEAKGYYRLLDQVHAFPKLIDSRGRIHRYRPQEQVEGALVGQPISPGVVRGPVKCLNTPDEKPLLPGDILVTKATDPGWTPLFINASAILLEVGGLLQHGALVAREYGKPCIVGVDRIMDELEDGQWVEVDATRGIIRMIEAENETAG